MATFQIPTVINNNENVEKLIDLGIQVQYSDKKYLTVDTFTKTAKGLETENEITLSQLCEVEEIQL